MNTVNILLGTSAVLYIVGAVLLAYVFIPRKRNKR